MPTMIVRRMSKTAMTTTTTTIVMMIPTRSCSESWIVCGESERRGRRRRYVYSTISRQKARLANRVCRQEAERLKEEQEARERNIALGNPLLNKQDFNMKRRWDDDVVFKNQARGTEDKGKKKEFVNVSLVPLFCDSICIAVLFYVQEFGERKRRKNIYIMQKKEKKTVR